MFLESAVNPSFRHNLFHVILYRYHVQGETTLPNPGFTPYYDQEFFSTIRHYHEHSPMNVSVMTIRQWYSTLLEDRVLMSPVTEDSPAMLLPVRVETLSPSTSWKNTWRLARLKGLESDLSSFLFKILHRLLPTQDRVFGLGVGDGQLPGLCLLCQTEVENPMHAFFVCSFSRVAGLGLLGLIQELCPDLLPEDVLQLELGEDLSDAEELAAVCSIATGLKFIWEARIKKKQSTLFQVRAELEAKILLLRRTRYQEAGLKMQNMLEFGMKSIVFKYI